MSEEVNSKKQILVILGDPSLPDPVKKNGRFNIEDFQVIDVLKQSLARIREYEFVYLNNHKTLVKDLKRYNKNIHLALNLCDEGFLNNPLREKDIPLILESQNIKFTGAGSKSLEVCFNKEKVAHVAVFLNITVPKSYKISDQPSFPVIVKPKMADGGLGITQKSVIYNDQDWQQIIKEYKIKYKSDFLIQEFLPGKDLTFGLIGNNSDDFTILPVTEEDYSILPKDLPAIQGYEAKWLPNSIYWQIRSKLADIPVVTRKKIETSSIKLFHHLECHDYARFDWRLDSKGQPKLLEVNPNPGWCWDGHLAKTARLKGISYTKMLKLIIKAAEKRLGLI